MKAIPIRHAPRSDDLLRLEVLRRARAGESAAAISRSLSKGPTFAQVILDRIRAADLSESGEPPATVGAAYPPVRKRQK